MKTKIKIISHQFKVVAIVLAAITSSILLAFFIFSPAASSAATRTEFSMTAAQDQELWQLNQKISEKKKAIDDLKRQAEIYKKTLAQKQQKIISLTNQLSQINNTIAKVTVEVESLQLQVEEVNLRLSSTQLKISAKEQEISKQKDDMATMIRALDAYYKDDNLIAILATSSNLGDYMDSVGTFQNLETALFDNLDQMNSLKIALLSDQSALTDNKNDLDQLVDELQGKKGQLESQQYVKNSLVKDTRGEESKYQKLLEQAKAEAEQVNSDIVNLEKIAREKLNRQVDKGSLGSDEEFMWPVPSHTINAYFHDPDYPFRNVFEHPGIDLRAAQGTEVRAAKSGYIARAKDAGMGYSYVLIVHDNNISTVYGHLSKILVAQDNYVTKGQIIGYSGGTPHTPGAGSFVTGPHLHFEVRVGGIPVNPLNYLLQ